MVSTASNYPRLGIAEREAGKPHILLLERIRPFDVEMVYSMLHWWRQLSDATVSILNIWPLDTYAGLPSDLDLDDFDAVVLFPRLAYDPVALAFLDRGLATTLRDHCGVKVLMRQDEHHMTRFTEDFIIDNEFDMLLSCVPQDQVPIAYPRLADHGVAVHTMLTGYVSPDMRTPPVARHADRTYDISYRAYRGAWAKGDLVYDKYRIGIDALEHLAGRGLHLDISLDDGDRLVGDAWRRRLHDTRAVLGTESGSNLFDFDGSAYRWSMAFEHQHRNSGLDEPELYAMAREELHHLDGNVRYAQISPRHLEAAASGCMQLLFPGRYSDLFRAGEHYVELQPDFSNVDDVVAQLLDPDLHLEMTTRAFEEIVLDPALSIENALRRLDGLVLDAVAARVPHAPAEATPAAPIEAPATALRIAFDARTPLGGHRSLVERIDGVDELVDVRLDVEEADARAPQRGAARIDLAIRTAPPTTATPTPDPIAGIATRLAEFADAEPSFLRRAHGAGEGAGRFVEDCRIVHRAIGVIPAVLDPGTRPACIVASDPQSVPVAACVALHTNAELILDFDGLSHGFSVLPGWQNSIWQSLVAESTAASPRVRTIAGTLPASHNAISLVGIEPTPTRAEPTIGPVDDAEIDDTWRQTDQRAWRRALAPLLHPAGDTEARLRRSLGGAVPDEMHDEVLPRIAETYGPESSRYWGSTLSLATIVYRESGATDGVRVWLSAIETMARSADAEAPGSSRGLQLEERRIAAFANALRLAGDDRSLRASVVSRLATGAVPFVAENRRLGWNLLDELRTQGDPLHDQLFDRFVQSGLASSPELDADDVRGLLSYIGHHWALGDLEAAGPAAAQLEAIHRSDAGPRVALDANVLGRIGSILRVAGGAGSPGA